MPTLKTQRFPDEFEALLSAAGRRVLHGKDAKAKGVLSHGPFYTATDLVHSRWVHDGAAVLNKAFGELMTAFERELPNPFSSVATGMELLPKVCRMLTSPMTPEALERAKDCGLYGLMKSESYHAFATVLAGRAVRGPDHMQVLAYRPGDYAGPHTDNHPHDASVRHGYLDLHLTFCTRGVTQQLLVYQKDHHLTEVSNLAVSGAVTAYRLPFWHYTTPLQVKFPSARRWLVLGTFIDV